MPESGITARFATGKSSICSESVGASCAMPVSGITARLATGKSSMVDESLLIMFESLVIPESLPLDPVLDELLHAVSEVVATYVIDATPSEATRSLRDLTGMGRCIPVSSDRRGRPSRRGDHQVGLQPRPETGRRAVVARDEGRAAAAVPRVPRPAEVTHPVGVGPGHVGVDEAVRAVVLAELAGDDRVLRGDGGDLRVPARGVGARVEVVKVKARRDLAQRVGGHVREPAG